MSLPRVDDKERGAPWRGGWRSAGSGWWAVPLRPPRAAAVSPHVPQPVLQPAEGVSGSRGCAKAAASDLTRSLIPAASGQLWTPGGRAALCDEARVTAKPGQHRGPPPTAQPLGGNFTVCVPLSPKVKLMCIPCWFRGMGMINHLF